MSKVLIVDDSALARKLLRKMLEKMGHEIVGEAETGEKALLLYRTTIPDIVTMDLVMPGIGGIEASKKILSSYPGAKIIITSSHMQNNQKSELINNGLDFLVLKPIDESKLLDAIHKILAGVDSNINMDDSAERKLRTKVQSFLSNIAKDIQTKGLLEENGLNVGAKVSISHYFSEQPLAAEIISTIDNELTLSLEKKIINYNFCIGDPINICFLSDSTFKICEGSISETIPKEKSIRVAVEKISLLHDDALIESFPTSTSIDFKMEYYNKKQTAILANIGPYNMRMVSNAKLDIGEKIIFNIFIEEKIVSLNAEIVSRKQWLNNSEYELKTTFIDLNSKKLLKFFIQQLRENHEKTIYRLIGEK